MGKPLPEEVRLDQYLWVPVQKVTKELIKAFTYELDLGEEIVAPNGDVTKVKTTFENFDQIGLYYRFPRGDLQKVFKFFPPGTFVDARSFRKWEEDETVVFTPPEEGMALREVQRKALLSFIKKGAWGVLQAPPRWGKTVWATALLSLLRQKALVIAHTTDLLNQLQEEFRTWTNVEEVEKRLGYRLTGRLGKDGNMPFPLVTFSTWQWIYSRNKSMGWSARHRSDFGLILVDEAHRVTADCYDGVVNEMNTYHRVGITATPYHSKTLLHYIEFDSLGPVRVEADVDYHLPVLHHFHKIDVSATGRSWARILNKFAENGPYNAYIAKNVVNDVRHGHKVMVISERVGHVKELARLIRGIEPSLRVEVVIGVTPDPVRQKIRSDAKEGKVDVIVATARIVELGYNVPVLSSLHNTMPLTSLENWYQRISRIRTPHEGKKSPIVHIYLPRKWNGVVVAYKMTIEALANEYEWKFAGPPLIDPDLYRMSVKDIYEWSMTSK